MFPNLLLITYCSVSYQRAADNVVLMSDQPAADNALSNFSYQPVSGNVL
jgi:hypothetical protein